MQNKKPEITPGHILQIKITADGLFWNELLPNAAENFRQKRTIYAVNIDPTQYSPLPSVKQYQIGGKALIWIANMKDDIALEKSYFSDLSLADATRIKKGQRKVVGKYNPENLTLPPREIAIFLLKSGIIQTFDHIEANIHLVSEKKEGNLYQASFDATHTYYTNEEVIAPYTFEIDIDLKSGRIELKGPLN